MMDANKAARTALYGMGGRALLEEAAQRKVALGHLRQLGQSKAEKLLREGRAPDQGYLVMAARNEMRDALRLLRDIDLGRRGPSHDDRILHDWLRPPDGLEEGEVTDPEEGRLFSYYLRDWRLADDKLQSTHYAVNGRIGYSPRREPKREKNLSLEAYRVANEILTLKERQVIDGTLDGKTQEQIGAYIGHQQPYVSKLLARSIQKLTESGHPELEALGWRLHVIGRESKRRAVG